MNKKALISVMGGSIGIIAVGVGVLYITYLAVNKVIDHVEQKQKLREGFNNHYENWQQYEENRKNFLELQNNIKKSLIERAS